MVPYKELAVADPLARALQLAGFGTVGWIVALGATVSMSAVLLVFQYGQPRIFFAMARDGLLPQWAARISPRTKIPAVTTMITGIFVAAWSLIGDAGETYDLTNIGTLFAFMLVSIGVGDQDVPIGQHADPAWMLQTSRERIDFKSRRRDRRLSLGPTPGRRHLECWDAALRPRLWYGGSGCPTPARASPASNCRDKRVPRRQRAPPRARILPKRASQFTVSLVGCSHAAESPSETMAHDVASHVVG